MALFDDCLDCNASRQRRCGGGLLCSDALDILLVSRGDVGVIVASFLPILISRLHLHAQQSSTVSVQDRK